MALARHYREFEGLTIQQIADRLGRAPATIKAYFYDPTGEQGAGGQGPVPGGVPQLRRVHAAAQRQGAMPTRRAMLVTLRELAMGEV